MAVPQSGQYSCFRVVFGVTFSRFCEDGCVRFVDAEGDADRVRVELPRRKDGGRRCGVAGVSVASFLLSIVPREASCECCLPPPLSLFLSMYHRQHRAP